MFRDLKSEQKGYIKRIKELEAPALVMLGHLKKLIEKAKVNTLAYMSNQTLRN